MTDTWHRKHSILTQLEIQKNAEVISLHRTKGPSRPVFCFGQWPV